MSRNRNRTYQPYSQPTDEEFAGSALENEHSADSSLEATVDEPVASAEEVVQEPAVQEPAVAAAPAIEVVQKTTAVSVSSNSTTQDQSRIMKSIERDLVSYMEAVDPSKPVTLEFGASWQNSLFVTIRRVINNQDPAVFRTEWSTLLAFFHKHQEQLFNENFMFRFQAGWKGSAVDFKMFRHLVYLAIRTADPKTRKSAVHDCNLGKIVEGLPATASSNLVSFYS